MLTAHENSLYPQNFEVFIFQILFDVSNDTPIINCSHILYLSQSFRKRNYSSMEKEQQPKCKSSIFLPEVRQLLSLHDYQKITSIEKYNDLVQQLIKPLNQQVKDWRDSGICPNCMISYTEFNFEFCVQEFDKIIGYQIQEKKNRIGKLKQAMQYFDSSLDFFEQEYNCVENQ